MFEMITDLLPTLQENVLSLLDESKLDTDGECSSMSILMNAMI